MDLNRRFLSIFADNTSYLWIYIMLSIIVAIVLESRSSIVGFSAAGILIYLNQYRIGLNLKKLIITAILLGSGVLALAGYMKVDSSLGRLFIYKISFAMYKENWLFGVGMGQFKSTYPYYQANYFAKGVYSDKELLLADNTYYVFNDYFQFIIEAGVVGIVAVISFMVFIVKLLKTSLSSKNHILVLRFCVVTIISICVSACFNHIFYLIQYQVGICILICLSSYLAFQNNGGAQFTILVICLIIFFGVVGSKYDFNIRKYLAEQRLDEINNLYRAGSKLEAKRALLNSSKILNKSASYLKLQSYIQFCEGDLEASEATLRKLLSSEVSSDCLMKIGRICQLQNDFLNAEIALKQAINMVPNRFKPRYLLYQLYVEHGNFTAANRCKSQILSLPIKVPSTEVSLIRSSLMRTSVDRTQ